MLNCEMANGFNISFNKTLQVAWEVVPAPDLRVKDRVKHMQARHFEMTEWISVLCLQQSAFAVFVAFEVLNDENEKPGRGKTRQWIRRRDEKGYFNNIVKELAIEDTAEYKEMMRMSHADFQRVLSYIEQDITRKQVLGGNIPPKERLALAIRFLATGETYRSLSYQFRISTRAISYIIKEVCEAIIKNMRNTYLKVPSSPEEWLTVAEKFESRWQFPNSIGAIDDKHITMQPPGNSGSYYYNYKHTNYIVLMAVPNYECLYYDIGTNGRVNDGGVWESA